MYKYHEFKILSIFSTVIESTKDLSLSEERQRSPTKPSATSAESEEAAASVSSGAQDNKPELVALNPKKVKKMTVKLALFGSFLSHMNLKYRPNWLQ